MDKQKHEELNKLFEAGKQADLKVFAEIRNNYLLHNGEHWKKISEGLSDRLKQTKLSDQSKIRLTKNHIQVVTKTYINNALSEAPGVQCQGYNTNELRDTKDAELSQAVWETGEIKQNMPEKREKFITSFFVGGECIAFIYWNPLKGKFKGYEQKMSDEGQPLFENSAGEEVAEAQNELTGEMHEPAASKNAVFEGDLCIELIHPFNLVRPESAESLKDAAWLGVEEMLSVTEAKKLVESIEDEEEREKKLAFVKESGKTTFKIFDTNRGVFSDSKDKVLFKKMFWRPCAEYPLGWFSIFTEAGEIFSGELPFADVLGDEAFPLITETCDDLPTHPRGFSIIKPLRAPQANLNSLASQAAYHALVMGDDKVITRTGSKLTKGGEWAGLREYSTSGEAPTVIGGRAGDQFEGSIARETNEIYKLAMLDFEMAEKAQQDPMAMLYSNLRQRKKFSLYVTKIERFLVAVTRKYLAFARCYLDDEAIIRAVGKREAINIAEFKNTTESGYNIKLKPMSQDLESTMGQFMEIQYILQYVGKDLPPNIRNKIISRMPFINKTEAIDDLMLTEQNIISDILALDRGEIRPASKFDDHSEYVAKLVNRQKQSDFRLLDPNIQAAYQKKQAEHEQYIAKNAAELKAQQAEFIPTGGGLSKVDIYDPKTGKRAILPTQAIEWLVSQLETQGASQESLGKQDDATKISILQQAQAMNQQSQQQAPQQQQDMQQSPLMQPQ